MRQAFTLIELVIIILILGILAAVGAIKAFSISEAASDNGAKESLRVIREAIEVFTAKTGESPGADGSEATFKSDLTPHLRRFPRLAVGPKPAQNGTVLMSGAVGPPSADASPTEGWKYYFKTGDFVINVHEKMKVSENVYYDEL